jgi:hypothetical protein
MCIIYELSVSFSGGVSSPVAAPTAEFGLLRHLLENQGHDVYAEPRTVGVHIRCLRKAINADVETD